MKSLVTGLGWDNSLRVESRSPSGEKVVAVINPGDDFSISASAERRCVGYRPPGGESLLPCPEAVSDISSHQCPNCFNRAQNLPCLRCVGDYCRNPARRSECVQPENHGLYLAAFAPGLIKVGVAKWHRLNNRLSEQGARQGLIIARDDGQLIRRSEAMVKSLGLRDRVSPQDKLRAMSVNCSPEELQEELAETLATLQRRMRSKWIEPFLAELPDHPPLPHTRLLEVANLDIHGQVVDTVGQLVIIRDQAGEHLAVDGTSLIGREISELDKEQGANYQMALLA